MFIFNLSFETAILSCNNPDNELTAKYGCSAFSICADEWRILLATVSEVADYFVRKSACTKLWVTFLKS